MTEPAGNHGLDGPLTGYKILELGANISVPWATMLLGDQGAEVIKLEISGGDQTRVAGNSRIGVEGMATMFLNTNRNKRSIVLDMKSEDGQRAARAIAAKCDVIVQNFRPGVTKRLGIDYESVKRVRSDIVYVSVDGLGNTGPGAQRRVYDIVVQGMAGFAAMQATRTTGEPNMINSTITDKITAMAVWQAVTAALLVRERRGIGQHIQISMLDAAIAFLWPDVMTNATLSGDGVRQGASPASVRFIFPTADGHIIVGMFAPAEWKGLCLALDKPELVEDPRFLTLKARLMNVDDMNAILASSFQGRVTDDWIARLEAHDAVYAPVNSPDNVADDPCVIALGTIEQHEHPIVGPYRQAIHPAKFEKTPASIRRHAPALGADTDEVLREFLETDRSPAV
jgi:crotonobetainyl-CoA:carnitine CoA-transferase CaiB-like acyl-CoA transferase